jgi:hypothetical protein
MKSPNSRQKSNNTLHYQSHNLKTINFDSIASQATKQKLIGEDK